MVEKLNSLSKKKSKIKNGVLSLFLYLNYFLSYLYLIKTKLLVCTVLGLTRFFDYLTINSGVFQKKKMLVVFQKIC